MQFKRTLIAAGVAFLALTGAVLSQSITAPMIASDGLNNNTDIIAVVPNGQPQAQSRYATPAQITNAPLTYKAVAVTGFNYSFGANVTYAVFNPAGTLAAGYVILASAPADGARNCIFSTAAITQISICTASVGLGSCTQTSLNNAITTLSANTGACYTYSKSNATWDRS